MHRKSKRHYFPANHIRLNEVSFFHSFFMDTCLIHLRLTKNKTVKNNLMDFVLPCYKTFFQNKEIKSIEECVYVIMDLRT